MTVTAMDLSDKTPWHDDPRMFDLLADGELADDRLRELLIALDDHPEGWRRCALALLEAQAWRRELRAVAREPDWDEQPRTEPAECVSSHGMAGLKLRRFGTPLAMAASFLVAFALGLGWRGVRSHQATPPGSSPGDTQVAADAHPSPAAGVPAEGAGPVETGQPDPAGQVVTVAFDGVEGEPFEVPVMSVERFDPAWLRGEPAAVPADVVRELRRRGHRVEQFRDLVPVELQDGRRLVLPVDQIEVHYAGQHYQ